MNKAPNPDQPEPLCCEVTKNSKSSSHKETQKAQRIQFFLASLELFAANILSILKRILFATNEVAITAEFIIANNP